MRVIVVGKYYSGSFAQKLSRGLQTLGHQVTDFEVGPRVALNRGPLSSALRTAQIAGGMLSHRLRQQWVGRRLVQAAVAEQADLVIVSHDYLLPEQVRALKRAVDCPVCLWFPDAIINFGRSMFLNAPYDVLFFKDPYAVKILSDNLAVRTHYLPECGDVDETFADSWTTQAESDFACDITIAGNFYPYRQAFFSRLADYDVRIWGNPPPRWMITGPTEPMIQNRYLTGKDLARAYRAARIVINSLHPAEIWGLNARAFAVNADGGFQMVDWRPGLDQLFVDGEELIAFHNYEDLRRKIDYYLPREDERRRIARAGFERVRRDHTYSARLQLLLATVHGDARGFPLPSVSYRS